MVTRGRFNSNTVPLKHPCLMSYDQLIYPFLDSCQNECTWMHLQVFFIIFFTK